MDIKRRNCKLLFDSHLSGVPGFRHHLCFLYKYSTPPNPPFRARGSIERWRHRTGEPDSAEPKSIDEIHAYGFNIKPAPKGPGSVEYGHQKVRQYKQYWTKDSLNCIKEQRNFRYVQDKNGKLTEKTAHLFSHGMDARRYGIIGKVEPKEQEEIIVYDAMSEVRELELI